MILLLAKPISLYTFKEIHSVCCTLFLFQIGDFGMARDLMDDTYYKSSGGKIPVKWTAPEVLRKILYSIEHLNLCVCQNIIENSFHSMLQIL